MDLATQSDKHSVISEVNGYTPEFSTKAPKGFAQD